MARPAKVKYLGDQSYIVEYINGSPTQAAYMHENFTVGNIYNAYFNEYCDGDREWLHVEDDNGEIQEWCPLDWFEVIYDPDNCLNNYGPLSIK